MRRRRARPGRGGRFGWPRSAVAAGMARLLRRRDRVRRGGRAPRARAGRVRPAVASLEPWPALVLVPAALAVGVGFGAYARAAWRAHGRRPAATAARGCGPPRPRTPGRIPKRVRRLRPAALAAYELPMGLLGLPGRRLAVRRLPDCRRRCCSSPGPRSRGRSSRSRSRPFAKGRCAHVGWQVESSWLPVSDAGLGGVLLYLARHRRRRLRVLRLRGREAPDAGGATAPASAASVGAIGLVLVVAAVRACGRGIGGASVRYAYGTRFTARSPASS